MPAADLGIGASSTLQQELIDELRDEAQAANDAGAQIAADMATETSCKSIVQTAVEAGSFNTLVAAVQAAGLVDTLNGDGPFTVFAPTDAAFANLPAGTVDDLLKPQNKDKLVAVLTYHVVPGKVMSADIVGKTLEVASVQGSTLDIDATNGVKVDQAMVVTADIEACNGVIHVVDAVLLP